MTIPVQQFQPLSFEQANPGIAGYQAGQQMAANNLADQLNALKATQLSIQNQYLPQDYAEYLKKQKLANALSQVQLQYAPDTAKAENLYKLAMAQYYPGILGVQQTSNKLDLLKSMLQRQALTRMAAAITGQNAGPTSYDDAANSLLQSLTRQFNGNNSFSSADSAQPSLQQSNQNNIAQESYTPGLLTLTSKEQQAIADKLPQFNKTGLRVNNIADTPDIAQGSYQASSQALTPTSPSDLQKGMAVMALGAMSGLPGAMELGKAYYEAQRQGTPLQQEIAKSVAKELDSVTDVKNMAAYGLPNIDEYLSKASELPEAASFPIVRSLVAPVLSTKFQDLKNLRSALMPILMHLSKTPARGWSNAEMTNDMNILGNPESQNKQAILNAANRVKNMINNSIKNQLAYAEWIKQGKSPYEFKPIQMQQNQGMNIQQPYRLQGVKPISQATGKVRVISPSGQAGYIPANRLNDYLKNGFKRG